MLTWILTAFSFEKLSKLCTNRDNSQIGIKCDFRDWPRIMFEAVANAMFASFHSNFQIMWAWHFFSLCISSKNLWDDPVHHKHLISSVWKLMPNPVEQRKRTYKLDFFKAWLVTYFDIKNVAIFLDFDTPLPHVGSFLVLSIVKFGEFLTPPPLKHADILNGWSLRWRFCKILWPSQITWTLSTRFYTEGTLEFKPFSHWKMGMILVNKVL